MQTTRSEAFLCRFLFALSAGAALMAACGGPDPEVPPIVLTAQAAMPMTSEGGGTAAFTVVLGEAPTADVVIPLSTTDESEGIVFLTSLTFTPNNWDVSQSLTVAGQDDELVDGARTFQLVLGPAASADTTFDGATVTSPDITNADNDSPGIAVTPPVDPTTESGGEVTFGVVLNTMPAADVTIVFESSDPSEGVVATESVTFTSENWSTLQAVRVAGVDDSEQDGDQTYTVEFRSITSDDAAYAALALPGPVTLTNEDDDTPGVVVEAASSTTSETGRTATFSVRLESPPTGPVQVNFDTSDASEGVLDAISLSFSASNWSTAQVVTVTGVNDELADGDQTYEVVFTAQTGEDSRYTDLAPPASLSFTNEDDDAAAIRVTAGGTHTSELGMTVTFSVSLGALPASDVVVSLASDTPEEGTADRSSLTFTTTDWATPQEVTVTGVDDDDMDGPQVYGIEFTEIASEDAMYAALTPPAPVMLTNYDDETPFRIRSTYIDMGSPTYVGHSKFNPGQPNAGEPTYHVVLARLSEPSMVADDFLWYFRPGLSDPSDPALVSLEPASYPGTYFRFDSAMPDRWPICGQPSTYGWALCNIDAPSRQYLAWLDAVVDDDTYESDATFRLVPSLDGGAQRYSFQWQTDTTRYVHHVWFQIVGRTEADPAPPTDAAFTLEQ